MLKRNESNIDRILRVAAGIALVGAYFFIENASPFLLVGIIPLATGLIGSCPIYSILGVSTCPMKKS